MPMAPFKSDSSVMSSSDSTRNSDNAGMPFEMSSHTSIRLFIVHPLIEMTKEMSSELSE